MRVILIMLVLFGDCIRLYSQIKNELLGNTVFYQETKTFVESGYTYQCDVLKRARFVTLYNKENKLTYEDIVYKYTRKIFSCDWLEDRVVVRNDAMTDKTRSIVDEAFPKSMTKDFEGLEFTIIMRLNSTTGDVMEVPFNFTNFSPYGRVPIAYFRKIEVELKNQIHYTPGTLGKQLNYIMLAWRQCPKGYMPLIENQGPSL